jgi:hypothetical protein
MIDCAIGVDLATAAESDLSLIHRLTPRTDVTRREDTGPALLANLSDQSITLLL